MIWLLIFNPLTLLVVYIAYAKSKSLARIIFTMIGAPIDLIVNVTWFSLIFGEFPKELLLTKRVSRLKTSIGYRGWLAASICRLLNRFEPEHCK